MTRYVARLVDATLDELIAEVPAILLTGPRASGKTTTARRLVKTVVQLDRPEVGAMFRTNPDAALSQVEEPALLDEWQEAPEVIGALKRSIDADPRAGRFVLTGSASADLAGTTWPGTGRIIRVPMYGMTEREVQHRATGPGFLDRLLDANTDWSIGGEALDIDGYVSLALRSGFPEPALRLGAQAQRRWLEAYLQECCSRDALSEQGGRDPVLLRRWLTALAANTAGVVDDKVLYDAAQLDRRTAAAYETSFETIGVTERLPAYATNRLKRLIGRPKRYMVDPAIAAAALSIDTKAVLHDANLLGRLIDTYVTSQLRAELTVSDARGRLYHLRTDAGRHECDLIIDLGHRGIVAIEIKAAGAPTPRDSRHLNWLADGLGESFVGGVVFHTGPYATELADRIVALPIASLWSERG